MLEILGLDLRKGFFPRVQEVFTHSQMVFEILVTWTGGNRSKTTEG